jgi:L-alanine-DL-glutamate epimerase-like enolase superfamily enzyme
MQRVTQTIPIPVCTGESLYMRQGFRKLIEMQATSVVHIDVPKSGGLLESKRIAELADLYYIWTACHNPASLVGTPSRPAMPPPRCAISAFMNCPTGWIGGLIWWSTKVRSGRMATTRSIPAWRAHTWRRARVGGVTE